MDTQLGFNWHEHVRTTDPETSRAAAQSVSSVAKNQQQMILNVLSGGEALAAEQISDRLAGRPMIWRRMADLERAGLVKRTDELHVNRSGRKAVRYQKA